MDKSDGLAALADRTRAALSSRERTTILVDKSAAHSVRACAAADPALREGAMLTIVFDLDGTLVDTAPDLIDTLNLILTEERLPAVPFAAARRLIGGGARGMIERARSG